jgi:hypothetical protein
MTYNQYTKSDSDIIFYNFETKDCKGFINLYSEDEIDCLVKKGYVALDVSIYPCIRKLNEKGYKTSYSCGGHFCTLPLYFEDSVTSDMLDKMTKRELLYYLSYINLDEIYIVFDFNNMDIKKRSKAAANIMAFAAKKDHLSFEKKVQSYIYEDTDNDGNEIIIKREGDTMYRLSASFYDDYVFMREQELNMEYESKLRKMKKIEIAEMMRNKIPNIRDIYDTWKFDLNIYLDFMANKIQPLE